MIIPPSDPRTIQRSEAWFNWRRGVDLSDGPRITASEIGIIIGVSPFKTPYRLWLEKTGQVEPPQSNFAQRKGIRLENQARLAYVAKTGNLAEPVCVQHDLYPEFAASLDGLTVFGDISIEIKVPGTGDHLTASLGRVPDHYYPQVQWQLFCSGAEQAHYWSYMGDEGVLVVVDPDPGYWETVLIPAARTFRQHCYDMTSPAGDAWMDAARLWRHAMDEVNRAKEILEEAENTLKSLMPKDLDSHEAGGVLATRVNTTGAVDYKKAMRHLLNAERMKQGLLSLGVSPDVVDAAMKGATVENAFLDNFRKAGNSYIKLTAKEYDPLIAPKTVKAVLVPEASSMDF